MTEKHLIIWLYFSENMTLYDQTKVTELEHTFTVQRSITNKNKRKRSRRMVSWRPRPGHNEVWWCPGQEKSLAPPWSNIRSFGSKCTVLKESTCNIVGTFGVPCSHSAPSQWSGALVVTWRPGSCASLPPFSHLWPH